MAEKQKPELRIVKVAARALKHPETVTKRDIESMAGRILDDQKNDPERHHARGRRPTPRGRSRGTRRS